MLGLILRWNQQKRSVDGVENLHSDAAGAHSEDSANATGPHDHEIGIVFGGFFENRIRGVQVRDRPWDDLYVVWSSFGPLSL